MYQKKWVAGIGIFAALLLLVGAGVGLQTYQATRYYVDGSANYIDTDTGEMEFFSTAVPGGVTLSDLSNASIGIAGTATGLNGETISVGVTDDEFIFSADGSSGVGATTFSIDGQYGGGQLIELKGSVPIHLSDDAGNVTAGSLEIDEEEGLSVGGESAQNEMIILSADVAAPQFLVQSYSTTASVGPEIRTRKSHAATVGTLTETPTASNLGAWYGQGIGTGGARALGALISMTQDGSANALWLPANIELSASDGTAFNDNQLVLHNDGTSAFGTDTPGAQVEIQVADEANVAGLLIDQNDATNNPPGLQIDMTAGDGFPLLLTPITGVGVNTAGGLMVDSDDNDLFLGNGSGLERVWTSGNDGASSGLDADLLDGEHASAFQDADATLTALAAGTLTENFTASDNVWVGLGSGAGRIEFDDQTTDEVNILNANVGIGTASPAVKLDVREGTATGANAVVRVGPASGVDLAAVDVPLGGLQFFNTDETNDGPHVAAAIRAYTGVTNGSGGYLAFATAIGNEGGEGVAAPNKVYIDRNGYMGLGKAPTAGVLAANLMVGTGTPGVANGAGDGYFTDALEVDGVSNLAGAVTMGAGATTVGDLEVNGGDIGIAADPDLIGLASGALTARGNFAATGTGTHEFDGLIRTDNGTNGTPTIATTAGEIYAEGDIEADGNAHIQGDLTVVGTITGTIVNGVMRKQSATLNHDDADPVTLFTLQDGDVVVDCYVEVTETFDGGYSATIGRAASTASILQSGVTWGTLGYYPSGHVAYGADLIDGLGVAARYYHTGATNIVADKASAGTQGTATVYLIYQRLK